MIIQPKSGHEVKLFISQDFWEIKLQCEMNTDASEIKVDIIDKQFN